MILSNLCDYKDAYILVKEISTVFGHRNYDAQKGTDERGKDIIFKNCETFRECISEMNNPQWDNAKDIDFLMQIYSPIECRDEYSKSI